MIHASVPGYVVAKYPAANSPDFYVSGFADGEEELGGTAAITDEPVGLGRAILFSSDPNFRAYTAGMQKVLWNALFGANPWAGAARKLAPAARATAEREAVSSARATTTAGFSGLRLTVRPGSAGKARAVLARLGAEYRVFTSAGKVSYVVAARDGPEGRLALRLGPAIRASGAKVVAFVAPR